MINIKNQKIQSYFLEKKFESKTNKNYQIGSLRPQSTHISRCYYNDLLLSFSGKTKNRSFQDIVTDIRQKNDLNINANVKKSMNSLLNVAQNLYKDPDANYSYEWLNPTFKNRYLDSIENSYGSYNKLLKFIILTDAMSSGLRGHIKDYKIFENEIDELNSLLKKKYFDSKLSTQTRKIVDKVYKEFGTKIFIPDDKTLAQMIYSELNKINASAKKTGEVINFPKNIDYFCTERKGYSSLNYISLNIAFSNNNDPKTLLRHELVHSVTRKYQENDTYTIYAIPFIEFLSDEESELIKKHFSGEELLYANINLDYLIDKFKNKKSNILKEISEKFINLNTLILKNLSKLNLSEKRIAIAFSNTEELLAVSYEKLEKGVYDEKFINLLKEQGLPAALLETSYQDN